MVFKVLLVLVARSTQTIAAMVEEHRSDRQWSGDPSISASFRWRRCKGSSPGSLGRPAQEADLRAGISDVLHLHVNLAVLRDGRRAASDLANSSQKIDK
jgi:hypothetical protein